FLSLDLVEGNAVMANVGGPPLRSSSDETVTLRFGEFELDPAAVGATPAPRARRVEVRGRWKAAEPLLSLPFSSGFCQTASQYPKRTSPKNEELLRSRPYRDNDSPRSSSPPTITFHRSLTAEVTFDRKTP